MERRSQTELDLKIVGWYLFYPAKEIKDLMAYMRFCGQCRWTGIAFKRIINYQTWNWKYLSWISTWCAIRSWHPLWHSGAKWTSFLGGRAGRFGDGNFATTIKAPSKSKSNAKMLLEAANYKQSKVRFCVSLRRQNHERTQSLRKRSKHPQCNQGISDESRKWE